MVLCAVLEITEAVVNPCSVDALVTIDGEHINGLGGGWLRLTDTKSAHVWLKYIPLPVHMQPEADDRKSNQLKPYVGQVTFYLRASRGLLFKSCGVHLAHRKKKYLLWSRLWKVTCVLVNRGTQLPSEASFFFYLLFLLLKFWFNRASSQNFHRINL